MATAAARGRAAAPAASEHRPPPPDLEGLADELDALDDGDEVAAILDGGARPRLTAALAAAAAF
jgi:hypothetical protein